MLAVKEILNTIGGGIVVVLLLTVHVTSLPQDGTTVKLSINRGRYVPELHGAALGKYMPDESGKYRHIHVPYDGGYGDRGLKYINDLQDILRRPPEELLLGPKDHLRFMIDFNYNASGWQILNFEWLRDGDQDRQYHYKNENQLWHNSVDASDDNYSGVGDNANVNYLYNYEAPNGDDHENDNTQLEQSAADAETTDQPQQIGDSEHSADYENAAGTENPDSGDETLHSNVHVQAEYNDHMYNVAYQNDNKQQQHQQNSKDVRLAIKEVLEYIQKYILPSL